MSDVFNNVDYIKNIKKEKKKPSNHPNTCNGPMCNISVGLTSLMLFN